MALHKASDQAVWRWAHDYSFVIVTKDADFVDLAVLFGAPPKIIRLVLGNVSNAAVRSCLIDHVDSLRAFAAGPDAVLIIGPASP